MQLVGARRRFVHWTVAAPLAVVAIFATSPFARADHGVCIPEDVDLVVPAGSPVSVDIRVTPGSVGTFHINYDVYDTFTADAAGRIRFTIPADAFETYRQPTVHFGFSAEQDCEDPTMAVSLGLPDTSTTERSSGLPWGLLVVSAGGAFLLSLLGRSQSGDIRER